MSSSRDGIAPAAELDFAAVLRAATLLRGFTDVGIRILAGACERRSVGRGTYAFRAGEESEGLSFIARGKVQMMPREGGAPLGVLGPGDAMGSFSLLAGGEHLLTAWAETDVELLMLGRKAWEKLQLEKPQAALKLQLALAQDLCERLRDAKGPLREFLAWQVSRRPAETR
jgi:CRP-like cAMP-binding protein